MNPKVEDEHGEICANVRIETGKETLKHMGNIVVSSSYSTRYQFTVYANQSTLCRQHELDMILLGIHE